MPKLTKEDQNYNYLFRGGDTDHDKYDPIELIDRVEKGLKPVAEILLMNWNEELVFEKLRESSVDFVLLKNRWSFDVVMVFRPKSYLGDYWSFNDVLITYTSYGLYDRKPDFSGGRTFVGLLESSFLRPIESFVEKLANEFLDKSLSGLLYGYPIRETLEEMKLID